ncbi:rCG53512 [Rattus norvegicus]|uniref:RCG53512 n=1 Tax=Rattus norvegicus TaxID=10116 RepID=A6JRK1_RAT|nr:rCG53512 [Rattus norvegicus]
MAFWASASEHPCRGFVKQQVFSVSGENFEENLSINSILTLTLIPTHLDHGYLLF